MMTPQHQKASPALITYLTALITSFTIIPFAFAPKKNFT